MISIIVGIVFIGVGTWGLMLWFQEFLLVLKGALPVSFILGGLIALFSGVTSLGTFRGRTKK